METSWLGPSSEWQEFCALCHTFAGSFWNCVRGCPPMSLMAGWPQSRPWRALCWRWAGGDGGVLGGGATFQWAQACLWNEWVSVIPELVKGLQCHKHSYPNLLCALYNFCLPVCLLFVCLCQVVDCLCGHLPTEERISQVMELRHLCGGLSKEKVIIHAYMMACICKPGLM